MHRVVGSRASGGRCILQDHPASLRMHAQAVQATGMRAGHRRHSSRVRNVRV